MSVDGLTESERKMLAAGVPDTAIRGFRHYYRQLAAGDAGVLHEREIEPVLDLPALEQLPDEHAAQRDVLDRAVIVKLNGGLGTSMGLAAPKSLLTVKGDLSFLDIVARQVLELRRRHEARLPLVLMSSFHTREASLARLARYPQLACDVPADFLQNREPKLRVDDLRPVCWSADPELEWCPPGHGDLYTALETSGMLATLLEHGYDYMFVSNVDNLGAVLEPRILAWLARERIPFASEQCERREADRKGGHLARLADGRLVLRETAQTAPEDQAAFEDVARHRFFNTNNLWVDLRALARLLKARDGVLGLPMIRNRKTVDPGDPSSPAVYQIETAMGAAISVFEGARALRVPRARFAPVKTTDDLLALRSDYYVLTERAEVVVSPARGAGPLFVKLDPAHFKALAEFEARFAAGPPSLIECERFVVRGDVSFGREIVARGAVRIEHTGAGPLRIPDGAVLEG